MHESIFHINIKADGAEPEHVRVNSCYYVLSQGILLNVWSNNGGSGWLCWKSAGNRGMSTQACSSLPSLLHNWAPSELPGWSTVRAWVWGREDFLQSLAVTLVLSAFGRDTIIQKQKKKQIPEGCVNRSGRSIVKVRVCFPPLPSTGIPPGTTKWSIRPGECTPSLLSANAKISPNFSLSSPLNSAHDWYEAQVI